MEFGQINSIEKDNIFSISQSFAFPSVYIHQARISKASVNSSQMRLEITSNKLAAEIKSTYWYLVYLSSKKQMLQNQDSLFERFALAAEKRAQAGETNQLEMISAQSQSMEAKNKLSQLDADIWISHSRLQRLMNTGMEFILADSSLRKLVLTFVPSPGSLAGNPNLVYQVQQHALASEQTRLEKAKALPEIRLGAFSQTMKAPIETNGIVEYKSPEDRFNGIQAGISVPIWPKPWSSRVKSSKIQEMIAIGNTEVLKQELQNQLDEVWQEYQKYKATLEFYEKSALSEADKIIRHSEISYKAGAIDYLDHLQNLQRALSMRSNYLDNLNLYNQSIISIEHLTNNIK
jgi:heavy metal efflux system protein